MHISCDNKRKMIQFFDKYHITYVYIYIFFFYTYTYLYYELGIPDIIHFLIVC